MDEMYRGLLYRYWFGLFVLGWYIPYYVGSLRAMLGDGSEKLVEEFNIFIRVSFSIMLPYALFKTALDYFHFNSVETY